jgi:hypothetical protein
MGIVSISKLMPRLKKTTARKLDLHLATAFDKLVDLSAISTRNHNATEQEGDMKAQVQR